MGDRLDAFYDRVVLDIFCTGCEQIVRASLITGAELYPTRLDLASLRFWKCETCCAFVGVHKNDYRNRPLGFLATPEVKVWRKNIHAILDPLWSTKKITRSQAYAYISNRLGRTFHAAEIYSVEEGKKVYAIAKGLKDKLDPGPWNR